MAVTATPNQAPAPKMTVPKPRGGQKAPDGETKAQKFRRLANRRVPRAIKAINAVANLGNANQYDYLPEQTAKIKSALSKAMEQMESAFSGKVKVADLFNL